MYLQTRIACLESHPKMPVPVSEILNPTPPPPPAPPAPPPLTVMESAILKLLKNQRDQGFSMAELRALTSLDRLKSLGISQPFSLEGIAAMTALSIFSKGKTKLQAQSAEEAVKTLLEREYITTQEYKGVPYYWAVKPS